MVSKNTYRVLEILLRNPTENYNINQVARVLKISVGGAHKILKELEGRCILTTSKLGNAVYYKIDLLNKEARKLCELVLLEDKSKRLADNSTAKVYAAEIEKFKAKIIVLFGSVLTKRQKANDIDVLFVVNKTDVEEVRRFCTDVSKFKTKPVIPLIMTESDFKCKLKERNKVILEIIRAGVVLSGEDTFVNLLEAIK